MKRAALYSKSSRPRGDPSERSAPVAAVVHGSALPPSIAARVAEAPSRRTDGAPAAARAPGWRSRIIARIRRHDRSTMFVAGVLLALLVPLLLQSMRPVPRQITQEDIDAAVLHTLEKSPLPSRPAKAAEAVRESVVRVRGFGAHGEKADKPKGGDKPADKDTGDPPGDDKERSVGSGVVVVDNGLILTNLHVVASARRIVVTFHDGFESEASIVGVRPENDLAIIKAKTIPDDLPAATLGSTQNLKPGDEVVAVGFPFGIGPSVSAGVVSGLDREFRSPEGERILKGLIQFDAAANPGSSGGPLVSMDGEVVGIVTAILNPTEDRTFIGIGFAATIETASSAVGIPPF